MNYQRSSRARVSNHKFKIGVLSSLLFSTTLFAGQVAAEEMAATQGVDGGVETSLTEGQGKQVQSEHVGLGQSPAVPATENISKDTQETTASGADGLVSETGQQEPLSAVQTDKEASSSETVVAPAQSIRFRSASTFAQTPSASQATEAVTIAPSKEGVVLTYHSEKPLPVDAKVLFAVWTEQKGQDDLVWYEADRHRKASVPYSHHKEYGTYNVHTYASTNGKMLGLDARTFEVKPPKASVEVVRLSDERYQVLISGVDDTLSSVLVPIWSEKAGQDDINWYQAQKRQDGLYQVTVDAKRHQSDFGSYHAHIYGQSTVTGGLIGLENAVFIRSDSRKPANVSLTDYAENKTSFTVSVDASSQTKPISGVRIAVWSEQKGHDDLKWYQPTVTAQGARQIVRIADHSNMSDNYFVHVYTDYKDGTTIGTDLGKYRITKPQEKQKVSAKLTDKGIALTLDSTTVRDYKQVRFAVWSDVRGHDDLMWYAGNDKGEAVALYSNHKGYGTYHIHTYELQNGQMVGLNTRTLTIPSPKVSSVVEKLSAQEYKISVSDVPAYISEILIPTWSDAEGQDDLKWNHAKRQTDGKFQAVVSILDHKREPGRYHAHLYGVSQLEGSALIGLGDTRGFDVPAHLLDPRLTITNHHAKEGVFDLVVTTTKDSKKVKAARVAVWSEERQSNLKWYQADATSGQVTLHVDARYHKYIKSEYHVHAYVTFDDGQEKGFVLPKQSLQADRPALTGEINFVKDRINEGLLDIIVSNVSPTKDLKQVLLPTWSEKGGQDDIHWYEATPQSDGTYKATVLLGGRHQLISGTYHTHLYYRDDLDNLGIVASKTIAIQAPEMTGKVTVLDPKAPDYTLKVVVSNVAARSGLKGVRIAVWSDANGQDDLQWYQAFQDKDGTYKAAVHLANHHYTTGTYSLHTYYELKNGSLAGVSTDTTTVQLPAPRAQILAELNQLLQDYRFLFGGVPGQKSLYITPTDGIETILENDSLQRSASTIKLFILAAAQAKAERGELDLNKLYTINAGEIVTDSGNLAAAAGHTYALRDIANFMIRTSDNTATNIMIKNIGGIGAVNDEIRRLGYNKTVLNRYMYDIAAINAGVDNYISAQESGDLIKNIYNKVAVSPSADQTMLSYLANNYHTNWFPSQLKGLAQTYDKPGAHASGVENDVAVIAKNGRAYVVSLLTQANGGDGRTHTGKFGILGKAIYNKLAK